VSFVLADSAALVVDGKSTNVKHMISKMLISLFDFLILNIPSFLNKLDTSGGTQNSQQE